MLDRLSSQWSKGWQMAALLLVTLLCTLFITGSASTRTTFEIIDGSQSYLVSGHIGEVSKALASAGVTLSKAARVLTSQEVDGVVLVTVQRPVTTYEETLTQSLPFEYLRQEDPNLPLGEEHVVQAGEEGHMVRTVKVVTDPDGTAHRSDLGEQVGQSPVDEIVSYGTKVEAVAASHLSVSSDVLTNIRTEEDGGGVLTTASGQQLGYSNVIECKATAYTTQRQSWKTTATGTTARVGAIAVDPKVIPYGTEMYIVSSDGTITYGVAAAEDCGGSIKGKRIDLFFDTYNECIQFGVRNCTVYILA